MAKKRNISRYEIESSLDLMTADRLIEFLDRVVREKGAFTNSASVATDEASKESKKNAVLKDRIEGGALGVAGAVLFGIGDGIDRTQQGVDEPFSAVVVGLGFRAAGIIALGQSGVYLHAGERRRRVFEKVESVDAELNSRANWFLGHHGLPAISAPDWTSATLDKIETALDGAETMRSSAVGRLSTQDGRSLDVRSAYKLAAENVMTQGIQLSSSPGLSLP